MEMAPPVRVKWALVIGVILCSNKMTLFFDIKTAPLIGAGTALSFSQLDLNENGSSDRG